LAGGNSREIGLPQDGLWGRIGSWQTPQSPDRGPKAAESPVVGRAKVISSVAGFRRDARKAANLGGPAFDKQKIQNTCL
jgi:hypothetical protein